MSDAMIGAKIEKAWGTEKVLVNGPNYCGKRLVVKPRYRTSMHRHRVKHETFIVESGWGWIFLGDEPMELEPGTIVEIPPGEWHCVWNVSGAVSLTILEISTHHSDDDVDRHSASGPLVKPLRVPKDFVEIIP